MSFGTIIQQGRFTSNGQAKTISIRSDIDWMWVYNTTILNDGGLAADRGAQFYWQRGMTQGRGLNYKKLGTVANDPLTTEQIAANSGFFLVNTAQDTTLGSSVNATRVDNGNPPLILTGDTSGLSAGDVVRLYTQAGYEAQQLGGIDFTIENITPNTSFELRYMSQVVQPAVAAAGEFFFRKVIVDPIYYPRTRYITKISRAAQAIVTLSVTHGYTVGQQVRFNVRSAQNSAANYGMTEIDGLVGNIVDTGQADTDGRTNTITVDIDTSAFTAFAFPVSDQAPFTPATISPVGEDSGVVLDKGVSPLQGATRNTALIGMRLAAGNDSPAGANNDEVYWVAGKSFSVDNQ